MVSLSRRSFAAAGASLLLARAGAAQAAPELRAAATDPFALGVASGDPGRDGFVIWTRLMGPGASPLQAPAVRVAWEVAADQGFKTIAASGAVNTSADLAHSVHVEVAGLQPGRPYWYRFHAMGAVSRIGRALTAPTVADRLSVALASCQHWEQGWFSAYRDLVAQNPELVLQVGDYIYEKPFGAGPMVRSFGAPDPLDLAGYRARHALYKTDADLQAAHAQCPWLVTWDDHEVENDYAGLASAKLAAAAFAQRRAAAYRAYFEHMPIRPSVWSSVGTPRLHRRVDWGGLAAIHVLDGRQHRTVQACGEGGMAGGRQVAPGCGDLDAVSRTMLGAGQEAWLGQGLARGGAHWDLIAQQVFFAGLDLGGEAPLWSDFWDGYPAARARLVAQLAAPQVRNPVVLTGDIHSFWLNAVRADPAARSAAVMATEIVTSCLASRNPDRFSGARERNPHVRFMDDKTSGYAMLRLDRARLAVDFRAVDDLARADSRCRSLARFVIADRLPGGEAA